MATDIYSGGAVAAAQSPAVTVAGSVFIPEVWEKELELAFKRKLVFGSLARDLSTGGQMKGDTVHIPMINEIASGTKKPEEAITWGTGASAVTENTLSIDQHTVAGVLIEDLLTAQSSYNLVSMYSNELGYSIALAIDDYIENALLDSCKSADGAINSIDLSGAITTTAEIESIFGAVWAHDPDPANWSLVVTPECYAGMANLASFGAGTQGAAIGAGFTTSGRLPSGTLMGSPVYISNNITTASTNMDNSSPGTDNQTAAGYCIHKTAINMAYSLKPRMQSEYSIDYLGTKMAADAVYGCKVINSSTDLQKRVFIFD